MSFTSFLTEGHTTVLSEESFLKQMRQHCNNAHAAAKTSGLFTSFDSDKDFMVIDPKAKAKPSSFMVDELIELLPSWKNTPHRRTALIGFTSLTIAKHYGSKAEKAYVMLPYDRASLCMLPATSFYIGCQGAERTLGVTSLSNGQLRGWLSSLRRIAKMLGVTVTEEEPHSGKELLKALQGLEDMNDSAKVTALEKGDEDDKERAKAFAGRGGSVLDFLSSALDPDHNRVEKLLAIHHNMPKDREVWTNSPCLLISLDAYKRLHEASKIK